MGNFALEYERRRQEELKETKDRLGKVCKVIEPLGITLIEVTYDGYGDSGTVENITFFINEKEYKKDLPSVKFESLFKYPGSKAPKVDIREIVDEICCSLLPDGWQDNDGSFGTLWIDVKEKTLKLQYNERYTDYNTSEEVFDL